MIKRRILAWLVALAFCAPAVASLQITQLIGFGSGGATAAAGQEVFTASGSHVVREGYSVVSAVCVGAGAVDSSGNGGRGGDLRYDSAMAVSPGETLTVTINTGGGLAGIYRSATPLLVARGGTSGTSTTVAGTIGGGDGGAGGTADGSAGDAYGGGGGGGAGGYSAAGGAGGNGDLNGNASTGGGGGGGGGGDDDDADTTRKGGGGGGVGLLGAGSNGTAGANTSTNGTPGGGGSAGANGSSESGGAYGGGEGGFGSGTAGAGACRIIWGVGRAYPSTGVADV